MTKSKTLSNIPGRTLAIALGIYAAIIAALALAAAGAASSLTSEKLQGVVSALQSIDSEREELARLRAAGQVSQDFVSAEMTKTAKLAEDLRKTAATMEVPAKDKAARDSATALADKIVAEKERRSR
jgi:hypothetical protein